jgi:predicted transcriptional regulator
MTPQRPHGIGYAFVLRRKDGGAAAGNRRKRAAYDHWHRTEKDKGRPYNFTTAIQLLDDFWKEVRRRSMKKESQTTYKVGSLREFAKWTKSVVRDRKRAHGAPKKWFDSEETAARAAAGRVSAETMVKLLSPGNLAVLEAIRRHKPASMRELAMLTGRKEASLSRTLKRFAELGIVSFQDGPHRTRVPALIARRVRLEIDLTGYHSAVAVDSQR